MFRGWVGCCGASIEARRFGERKKDDAFGCVGGGKGRMRRVGISIFESWQVLSGVIVPVVAGL